MVLEVAQFDVTPGQEDEFIDVYRAARDLVASTPGCLSMRMTRGVGVAVPVHTSRRMGHDRGAR